MLWVKGSFSMWAGLPMWVPSRAASCFPFQRALHRRQTRTDKKSRTLRKSFAILKKFDQEDSPSGPQR